MNCNYCKEPIEVNSIVDRDDDGNVYHNDCADMLRSKWDDDRQERMAEEQYEQLKQHLANLNIHKL